MSSQVEIEKETDVLIAKKKKDQEKCFTAALSQCNWALDAAIRKYTVELCRGTSAVQRLQLSFNLTGNFQVVAPVQP